jgi:hypothetical protein
MSLHPSGLLGVVKNLSEVTRFAFKRVESKLPPDARENSPLVLMIYALTLNERKT